MHLFWARCIARFAHVVIYRTRIIGICYYYYALESGLARVFSSLSSVMYIIHYEEKIYDVIGTPSKREFSWNKLPSLTLNCYAIIRVRGGNSKGRTDLHAHRCKENTGGLQWCALRSGLIKDLWRVVQTQIGSHWSRSKWRRMAWQKFDAKYKLKYLTLQ